MALCPKNARSPLDQGLTKICRSCYKVKPEYAFAKKRGAHDSRCKKCKNQKRRASYYQRKRTSRSSQQTITHISEYFEPESDAAHDIQLVENFFRELALNMLMEK